MEAIIPKIAVPQKTFAKVVLKITEKPLGKDKTSAKAIFKNCGQKFMSANFHSKAPIVAFKITYLNSLNVFMKTAATFSSK